MKNSHQKHSSKNPWNPAGIAVFSALFSIIPAGIIHALNYERLGFPERKKRALLFNTLSAAVIILLAVKSTMPTRLFVLLNISFCIYFQSSQSSYYQSHISNGGQKSSLLKPVLYTLSSATLVIGIGLSALHVKSTIEDNKFNHAVELFESGNFLEAEQILVNLKKSAPNATDIYYALSVIYLNTGQTEKAATELHSLLQIDSSSVDARQMLSDIQSFSAITIENYE